MAKWEGCDFGVEPRTVLWRSFRSAARARRPVVDTADVLAEAVRMDVAALRELLGRRVPDARTGAEATAATSDEPPTAPLMALRESRWRGGRNAGSLPPGWSATLRAAAEDALMQARSRGLAHVNGIHLVLGLLDDRNSAASRLVAEAGLQRRDLVPRLRKSAEAQRSGVAWSPLIDTLQAFGALPAPDLPTRLVAVVGRGAARLGGHRDPFLPVFRQEISRQAVLLGQDAVSTVHVVLAVGYVGQLGLTLRGNAAVANTAGAVLARHGFRYDEALRLAVQTKEDVEPVPPEEARGIWPALRPGDPVWGRRVVDRLAEARGAGTTLLLAATLASDDSGAVRLLSGLGLDPDAVRFDLEYDLAAHRS